MNELEVLQECTVEGNMVKLPNRQLDRKLYTQVNNKLQKIGGKWNRKAKGFVFDFDPTDLLAEIAGGVNRNIKKEFQFFETPPELADLLVKKAFELPCPVGPILEPSAGRGAIINAIHRYDPDIEVNYCEIMDMNRAFLEEMDNVLDCGDDFFETWLIGEFAIIIANPPFAKNQDIDHIMYMYQCLDRGGRLVSIASKHWEISSNKKETEFRNWLQSVNATIEDIPEGTFKLSGTMVGAKIITINKN